MIRPVRLYPDPILKAVAAPCGSVDDAVREVAADLVETMHSHGRCVGLSAPQIGALIRVIAVDVTGHAKAGGAGGAGGLIVLCDPMIVSYSGSEVGREGCLSLPHITANVRRATGVMVRGLGVDGETTELEATGFEARALQHEIDHLDGLLILDRVVSPSEIFPRK